MAILVAAKRLAADDTYYNTYIHTYIHTCKNAFCEYLRRECI